MIDLNSIEDQIKSMQTDYNYNLKEYTIDLALDKFVGKDDNNAQKSKSVIYIPSYQREYVWKDDMKSKFIESLILGIPMPPLFAFTLDDSGNMELLDGVQRLTTIKEFTENKFKLKDVELLDSLNGLKFKDLHPARQRKFYDTSIRIFVFSERADESIRADIYNRINSTGKRLTDAEIRKGAFMNNSLYRFILNLSEGNTFNNLFSSAKNEFSLRGEKEELTLRFFAYSEQYQEFKHSVRNFLNMYVKSKANISDEELNEKERDFENTFNFIERHFPNGFRKDNSQSIPRVRFEAISIGVNLALKSRPEILNFENINIDWLESEEFKKHTTSDAANNKSKLVGRIEYVKNKILENI